MPLRYLFFSLYLAMFTVFFLLQNQPICIAQNEKNASATNKNFDIPRADPGYIQQLEKRSMLYNSQDLAKIVSGSELAWRSGSSQNSPETLMKHADTWLYIHPYTIIGPGITPALGHLSSSGMSMLLKEVGAQGLYISPLGDSGDQWVNDYPELRTGDDVVRFEFSEASGSMQQYKTLMNELMRNENLMGSDLIPGATGLGPDFFLATRGYREYPGIYCLVDVPESMWNLLPTVEKEFDVRALDDATISNLSSNNILPQSMRDDFTEYSLQSGWAVTGPVRGLDGNIRRWVYRFQEHPHKAILNWEDPTQAAHRILSGSAVHQVGLLGQALIGMNFESLQGLEPLTSRHLATPFSIEPALTAAQSMSREIRRYGAWSWLKDSNISLNAVQRFLQSGVDFISDSAFSPAIEHALLTGDATFACFMADELLRLNIDTRRLVHTTPTQGALNYSLPHLAYVALQYNMSDAENMRATILQQLHNKLQNQPALLDKNFLYTTAPGLAAMALNLPVANVPEKDIAKVRRLHSMYLQFKAMQPGIFMLSGQDLVGALPLDINKISEERSKFGASAMNKGGYPLSALGEGVDVTRFGIPKTNYLYGIPSAQAHMKNSFISQLQQVLQKRKEMNIAEGTLVARPVTKSSSAIALLTRLPKKGYVLTIANFGSSSIAENMSLRDGLGNGNITAARALTGGGSATTSGQNLSLSVPAYTTLSFLLQSNSGQQQAPTTTTPVITEYVAPPAATQPAQEQPLIDTVESDDAIEEENSLRGNFEKEQKKKGMKKAKKNRFQHSTSKND